MNQHDKKAVMRSVCILSDTLQMQSNLQLQLPIVDANKYVSKSLLTISRLVVATHA